LFYEYRLKDDADWVTMEAQQIDLNYLSPDRYQLNIRVTDVSTGQVFEQQLLNFKIAAPFYMQWWFIFTTGLLIVGIIYLYFELKSRRQQDIRDAEVVANKRVEELKTEALLAQMNPHFIFYALHSIQYLVVTGENDKASDYLNKIAQLVRTNLNNSQRPFITLEEELIYLKTYCDIENERHNNRIHIDFQVDPAIDIKITEIPTLILQPFLENIFVRAFPPKIQELKLLILMNQMADDRISYEIRDNGIGESQPLKSLLILLREFQ
jgi:hypothetical protein